MLNFCTILHKIFEKLKCLDAILTFPSKSKLKNNKISSELISLLRVKLSREPSDMF